MAKQSLNDVTLTPDEAAKLKMTINSLVVNFQHQFDLAEQAKELVNEFADELDVKASEITDAARTVFKQNFEVRKAKQKALERVLTNIGYKLDSDEE